MLIGRIIKTGAHGTSICCTHSSGTSEHAPSESGYAFGRFVRVAVHTETTGAEGTGMLAQSLPAERAERSVFAIGVIYNTTVPNPNEEQGKECSSDDASAQTVCVSVAWIGVMVKRVTADIVSVKQGLPLLFPELGSTVESMSDDEVWAFHCFSDPGEPVERAYLHIGYVPHLIAKRNRLLLMVIPRIMDQLEPLFPHHHSVLSLVRRNFTWE